MTCQARNDESRMKRVCKTSNVAASPRADALRMVENVSVRERRSKGNMRRVTNVPPKSMIAPIVKGSSTKDLSDDDR